jgi:predicted dehydrogenase
MANASLPLAVIGLGRIGQVHVRVLAHGIEGARLVAVADVDGERARRTAAEQGVPDWYDNPEAVLAREDLRAVVIATPSDTHLALVEAAARAGKAILCEKPLALILEDTDRAIAAAARAGVLLQIGFMRRTQPDYLRLKRAIEAGELGRPVLFRSTQRDREPPPAAFCDPVKSGGIFLDMGIHEFDLGRWLLQDEVESVQAFASVPVDPELAAVGDFDNAVINLRFRGGAVGSVDLSRNAGYGEDIRTEVVGARGGAFVGPPPSQPLPEGSVEERYRPQMQAFVDAVGKNAPPPATGQDSRAALAISLAARASAETGQTMAL